MNLYARARIPKDWMEMENAQDEMRLSHISISMLESFARGTPLPFVLVLSSTVQDRATGTDR